MRIPSVLTLCLGTLLFLGCSDSKTGEQTTQKSPEHDQEAHDQEHQHADAPHGGSLIELGEEEYHGELVHDAQTGAITVYILDSKAKNAVPIDAKEITISAKSESYPLEAQPQESDPDGQSSRFVSTDKSLTEYVGGDDVHARLIVKIGDRSFNGPIVIHRD